MNVEEIDTAPNEADSVASTADIAHAPVSEHDVQYFLAEPSGKSAGNLCDGAYLAQLFVEVSYLKNKKTKLIAPLFSKKKM